MVETEFFCKTCDYIAKIIKSASGRTHCVLCRARVYRRALKENNCKHVSQCPRCRTQTESREIRVVA